MAKVASDTSFLKCLLLLGKVGQMYAISEAIQVSWQHTD